jgi:hypothetical protein
MLWRPLGVGEVGRQTSLQRIFAERIASLPHFAGKVSMAERRPGQSRNIWKRRYAPGRKNF